MTFWVNGKRKYKDVERELAKARAKKKIEFLCQKYQFLQSFSKYSLKMQEITCGSCCCTLKKMHQRQYFITKVYSKQIKTPFFDENGQGGDDDKQGSKILSIIMITAVYTGCPNRFGIG